MEHCITLEGEGVSQEAVKMIGEDFTSRQQLVGNAKQLFACDAFSDLCAEI